MTGPNMPGFQDLGQLQRHYAKGWQTFRGSAGVVQCLGNADAS